MLRNNNAADTYAAIEVRREASLTVDAEFMEVDGAKAITEISDAGKSFSRPFNR